MFTIELLQKALPEKHRRLVNKEVLDSITETLNDPDMYDIYRENFLSYIGVLQGGKFKIQDYVNAVKFVSFRLMGETNLDSYIKTFPDRYQSMVSRGMSAKDISSFVSAFSKCKLVNLIMERSLVPSWVLNQDLYQSAINVQADLMMNASSEKVRSDAANSLLIHLKPPEVRKVELDIGVKQDDMIANLKNTIAELASQQQRLIQAGVMNAKEVAETKLVTVVNHEDGE